MQQIYTTKKRYVHAEQITEGMHYYIEQGKRKVKLNPGEWVVTDDEENFNIYSDLEFNKMFTTPRPALIRS